MAAYSQLSSKVYSGLSTDTKPSLTVDGAWCVETDTGDKYYTPDCGTTWTKVETGIASVDFGTTPEADFNAQVDLALNTLIPASPTAGSINYAFRSLMKNGAPGKVYYCDYDHGSDTTGTGLSWSSPYKTISKALTVAVDHDTIMINAGIYVEDSGLTITQNNLKLIGVQTSGMYFGQPSIHTHETVTLCTVNAHQVEIANLSFHHQGAGTSFKNGTTAATWRTHIHNCFFGGNATALIGIDAGGTYDAPFTIIENCYFQHYETAAIHLNAFNSSVRNCIFQIGTGNYGIQYHPDTADRPYGYLLDNRFITTDGTNAVGISVENTPTAGMLLVDGNKFVGFADNDHCISKRTGYTGLNYLGITAIAIT